MLLIAVDTLRADHLGLYGDQRPISPNLDSLGAESLVYVAATSPAPFTMPAVAGLMTGMWPDRTGVVNHSRRHRLTDRRFPTLAELASEVGFSTAAVVANPWLADQRTGFARGFESFIGHGRSGRAGRSFPASEVTDLALTQLDRFGSDPFLLWVHYIDPHMPYQPRAEDAAKFGNASGTSPVIDDFIKRPQLKQEIYFGGAYPPAAVEATRALYAAEVAAVDRQIARLLARLRSLGRSRDTVVVVVSDHGEGLGEHGLWFAHDFTLYEELVHVAMIARVPDTPPARITEDVSLVDIFPSACRWMNLACDQAFDGQPLPLRPELDPDLRTVFAASAPARERYSKAPRLYKKGIEGRWTMARRDGLKVIHIPHPEGDRWEAYDLAHDPHELNDLGKDGAGARPFLGAFRKGVGVEELGEERFAGQPKLAELAKQLEQWEANMTAVRPEPTNPSEGLADSTEEALKSLGYLN